MTNYKVVKILKKLDGDELRKLNQFIQSPIHNNHKHVISLFSYLRKNLHAGPRKLNKEEICRKLFPSSPTKLQKLHHVNSYLLKVIEDFLAWTEWKEDPVTKYLYLAKSYRKHNLTDSFTKAMTTAQDGMDERILRDGNYYDKLYQLHKEKLGFIVTTGQIEKSDLQELLTTQDLVFFSEKLRYACFLLSYQSVMAKQHDTGLLDSVLLHLKDHPCLEIPAIGVYYYGYYALSEIDQHHYFEKLSEIILSSSNQFTQAELRDIYILAINCCIRKLNTGHKESLNEVFKLYKAGLKTEVFIENGHLSTATYNNIVLSGLKLKAFDWVERFLYTYKDYLPEGQQDGVFNYNLAMYYFEKGAYRQAMPLLIQREYDYYLYNLVAKSMLVMMYYEMEEMESLLYLLRSFKSYIQRKKSLGYHRELYLNFIHFTQRLIKLQSSNEPDIEQFQKQLSETKAIAGKDWLLRQLQATKTYKS